MDNTNPVEKVLNIFTNGWNRQVILYGPPGTSKTYSSTIIAAAMLVGVENNGDITIRDKIIDVLKQKKLIKENDSETLSVYHAASELLKSDDYKDRYKFVQFHPSYSYEDFVRGITVKTDSNGGVTYQAEPKIIEKFCEVCNRQKDKPCVMVIDEINRAPLASVLGELIYGLEYRGNPFTTPYEIKKETDGTASAELTIPDNLYIIGTMNTADRSIGSIDYAVRRRFAFVKVPSVPEAIAGSWNNIGGEVENLYNALMGKDPEGTDGIFDKKQYLTDPETDVDDIKIGHTYFLGKKEIKGKEQETAYMNYRINYQIRPIYMEYIKDGIINKKGLERFDKIVEDKGFEIFDQDTSDK